MRNNRNNGDGIYIIAIFVIILATILVLAAVCKFFEIAADAGYERADFETVVHVINPGEEAWNYAERYCPDGMNKHKYLEWCAEENGLESMGTVYYGRSYVFLKLKGEAK